MKRQSILILGKLIALNGCAQNKVEINDNEFSIKEIDFVFPTADRNGSTIDIHASVTNNSVYELTEENANEIAKILSLALRITNENEQVYGPSVIGGFTMLATTKVNDARIMYANFKPDAE